jgi:hypothetical protein
MSAVPVALQALQDPAAESIEPPSVDRELKSGRILHQACAHCPHGENILGRPAVLFTVVVYKMNEVLSEWIARGGRDYGHRGPKRDQGS